MKIQKFKQAQCRSKLESYFLQRKKQLDQVIYSLIRTQDQGLAFELYFRIQEQEQTFASLAKTYSEGAEAHTGGLIDPVEVGSYHPQFRQLLSTSQPRQLMFPMLIDSLMIILHVEERIPT